MGHTPYNSFHLTWRSGDDIFADTTRDLRYETEDLTQVNYPLPGRAGRGELSSFKLASGLSIQRSIFQFNALTANRPISAEVQMDLKEPCLLVHCVLVGGLTRHDCIKGGSKRLEPGTTLFQWCERTHANLVFDPSPVAEVLYLHASKSSLELLLGKNLASHLQYCLQTSTNLLSLPVSVTAPLKFVFDDGLKGELQKLHAQNKALEFLERLIRYFEDFGTQKALPKDFSAAHVMQYLKQQPRYSCSAQELADTFGVSVSTMNRAFTTQYGMSVVGFIKEQRMAYAHELLTNTKLTVIEIALQLGYSQLSNFSAAFKSFYGYSPTALRGTNMAEWR